MAAVWACRLRSFFILGFFGREVYRQAPPIPGEVRTIGGRVLMTRDNILTGQTVWQSTGGQQLGSIWGHGAYQAPDWTADWLHREATTLLDLWSAREHGTAYGRLSEVQQGLLRARLKRELRTNTFDEGTGVVSISADRAEAIARVAWHYDGLFGGAPALDRLRDDYAMHDVVVPDPARRQALTQFFFWLRIIGDTLFLIGVTQFAWFMAGFGWSYGTEPTREEEFGAVPSRPTV